MKRAAELDAFKAINLSLVASAFGYERDRKKSTRHSVLMKNGSDKIIISQNGQHYVYCSVHDPSSSGTIIDFTQQVIEPGCSLGRVRQLLRPFLGTDYQANLQRQKKDHYQADIRPSETDFIGVAARYARFEPIETVHTYLSGTRGIPFDLLQNKRLVGRIRHCPRRGSIVFPHWSNSGRAESDEHCLTGYEIKGRGVNLFSKGGRKGLWISAGYKNDRVLAIAESGLDAISYMAVRGEEGLRVGSISGQMNPHQPALIRSAIERMGQGSRIVAAFDNDRAGDELTEKLASIVDEVGRADLDFRDDRAPQRGADWNKVAMDQSLEVGRVPSLTPHFGR